MTEIAPNNSLNTSSNVTSYLSGHSRRPPRERMGFCTTSYLTSFPCPLCKNPTYDFHQYVMYGSDSVCCGNCYDSARAKAVAKEKEEKAKEIVKV